MEDRQSAQELGGQLKRLRKERKLSVRGLAQKAGIANSAVSRLERGERSPQPETLKTLATALGVPLADLYAMAGHLTSSDLPSMSTYLHTCYGELSDQDIASVDEYVQRLINEHGLDPNGPAPLEDETESSSRE